MRITQLCLTRYGHLSDEVLDFPTDRGLHVVLGANEAGKSTALQAVADGLFGFDAKTRSKGNHSFHHRPDMLRVGLGLVGADGQTGSFVRRKGNGSTLMDAARSQIPESALIPFLAGTSRKRFEQVFGLDAAELRSGAAAILTEQAGAGAAILQARTGLRGLRDAIARLDAEAKTLYGDGRGQRRISVAAAAVKENRGLVADRSLSGTAHRDAEAAVTRLTASLADLDADAGRLRAEQARLERIRRTAPIRGVLRRLSADRAALGSPPTLPPNAAVTRQQARAEFEEAARDCAQEGRRAEAARAQRDTLLHDPTILAEAELVTLLAADSTRIASARNDKQAQQAIADQHQRDSRRAAGRLGVVLPDEVLRAAIPSKTTRDQAARLASQYAKLSGARGQAADTLDTAADAVAAAHERYTECLVPSANQPLRDAVAAATREGRIDEALAEAETALADAEAAAAHSLAGLPLWSGPASRLAASPVPLDAEALRLTAMLDEAGSALRVAQADLDTLNRYQATIEADLAAAAAAGPLPTASDVANVRGARDALWALIRHGAETGGPAPAGSADFGPPGIWPDELSRLMRKADSLADRRLSEIRRVEAWDRLCADEARGRVVRERKAAAYVAAHTALDATEAEWRAAWQPAGVQPLAPASMRDWTRQRAEVLALHQMAEQARRKRDALHALHGRVRAGLMVLLPGRDGDVAVLLAVAIGVLQEIEAGVAAHMQAQAAVGSLEAAVRKAERRMAAIDADLGAWRAAWQPIVAALGLPPDGPAADAAAALATWAEVEACLHDADAAQGRVDAMQQAVSAHDENVAELARRLGEDLAQDLVPRLAGRLTTARDARAAWQHLDEDHRRLAASTAQHSDRRDRAAATLAELREASGAEDDAAFAAAISDAAAHADLASKIADRTAELNRQDDGKSAVELDADAAGEDVDAIPGRLGKIEARLRELDSSRTLQAGERADAQARLRALEVAQDVSGPTQAVADGLVEIEDAAARYVRLRLAHALLLGGIDHYRQSQQGPLLARAGTLFAELTGGRYNRLELDEDDKGNPVVAAARPDGTRCNADHLSEGTRDQLFLAMRLAAIAMEAEASEPMPLIADDLLVNFDDARARAAIGLLAGFGQITQVILFTHHAHIAAMADPATASLHHLPNRPGLATETGMAAQ